MKIINDENYKNLINFIQNDINKELFKDIQAHNIANIKNKIIKIYGESVNYKRHIYSDIYMILKQLKDTKQYEKLNEISEVVSITFVFLKKDDYDYENDSEIVIKLIKLFDHINLEIARSNVLELEFITPLKELSDKYDILTKEKDKIIDDIQNKEIDFLSKIGIFMSIFMLIVNNVSVYRNIISSITDYQKFISITLITNAIILLAIHSLLSTINKKYYNWKIVAVLISVIATGISIIFIK